MILIFLVFFGIMYNVTAKEQNPVVDHLAVGPPMDENMPLDFHIFFLEKHLEKEICTPSVIVSVLRVVNNQDLDVYKRNEILELAFTTCAENEEFKHAISLLSVEPELEWSLREKVLIYHQAKSVVCSHPIVEYLLESFSQEINWHIREAIVDILSESQEDCAQRVISFFSEFVMRDSEEMSTDLVDFRQRKIHLILWSLVRLGMQHGGHPSVVAELKEMAMKYDMNVYFRVSAVEALQDLSLYFEISAQALYEIVRDNKRVPQSDFITYDQRIRDANDVKVRDQAFLALLELLEEDYNDFFSFLSKKPSAEQIYRSKVFEDQPLPAEHLDLYARPALIKLVQDTSVEQQYRDRARFILQ